MKKIDLSKDILEQITKDGMSELFGGSSFEKQINNGAHCTEINHGTHCDVINNDTNCSVINNASTCGQVNNYFSCDNT